jgi:hypothetical protein
MQLPIHIIAGILTQLIISSLITDLPLLSLILVAFFALASHFLLDALAKTTYHPPERINDSFWLMWHIFSYGIGLILLVYFIWEFWLGILFANLPDLLDWYTLRNIASYRKKPFKPYLHPIANKIRSICFHWLPDLTYNRLGILPELIVIIITICVIFLNQLVS